MSIHVLADYVFLPVAVCGILGLYFLWQIRDAILMTEEQRRRRVLQRALRQHRRMQ